MYTANVFANKLTVVTEQLSFFQYQNNGNIEGYAVDIINELSKLADEDIDIQIVPWARAFYIASNQPNVLIFSIAYTQSRDDSFIWAGEIFDEPLYFWKLKNEDASLNYSIKEDDTYAASRSSVGLEYLKKHKTKNINIVNTQKQSLLLLYSKRVDFIISGERSIEYRAKKLNLDSSKLIRLSSELKMQQKLYFAFSLGTDPNIIEKYKKAYKTLVHTKKLSKIRKKWDVENSP